MSDQANYIRRKILIFVEAFSLGGAERQAYLLAKNFQLIGHQVEVWGFPASQNDQPLLTALTQLGIPCRTVDRTLCWSWKNVNRQQGRVRSAQALARFAIEFISSGRRVPASSFDWAIPFTPGPSLYMTLHRGKVKAKTVVWNHRGGADSGGFQYNGLLAFLTRLRLDGWVANSALGANFISGKLEIPRVCATHIQNIYEPTEDYKDESRSSPICQSQIVQVANIYPEKDPETLIRALALIAAHPQNPALTLIGRWIDENQLSKAKQLANSLGVSGRITFSGELAHAEVGKFLGTAAIGVLSSRSEGCPNAILEYMGAGLPIVATNINGISSILPMESKKLLFEVGDHHGCAIQLAALLDDPAHARSLGQLNHQQVKREFNGVNVALRWTQFLEGLSSGSFLSRKWRQISRLVPARPDAPLQDSANS